MSWQPAAVWIESGVSHRSGEGFCSVWVERHGRREQIGQLSPTEVRTLALGWLETAEAAEQDAALLSFLAEPQPGGLGLPLELAGTAIGQLRARRDPR